MGKSTLSLLLFLSLISCNFEHSHYPYPKLPDNVVTEQHFGISYENHFQVLENEKEGEVLNWFKKQDSVTESYFSSEEFRELLACYDSLENKDADPARRIKRNESGMTFYLSDFYGGKENEEDFLFVKTSEDSVKSELLFDPREYADGDFEIETYEPSYDGRYVAIALGKPELFFNHVVILDCVSKEIVGNPIVNAKPQKAGGLIWAPRSDCLTYIAYPNTGENENDRNSYTALYCINDLDRAPQAIFKEGKNGVSLNQEYYPVPKFRSSSSNYFFVYLGNASDFWDCYYISTEDFYNRDYNWKKLYSENDEIFYSSGIERNHIYYYKRIHDGNIEFCSVDLKEPDLENPKIIASGAREEQIGSFKITKDEIYYTITTNGISEALFVYDEKNGKSLEIELPISAGEITLDYRSPYSKDLWVTISGWTSNPKDYYLNSAKGKFNFVELGMWPDYPEFENIISEVVEVTSHDGTKVPLSIVRLKDHKFDSKSMGIITAYGAYGLSETPWFHSPIADFVNQGNIYASAHVRGGGEKGPKWHEAGMKSTKSNSWKDLIGCSEYLIDNKYVHPKKLGLNVNSAGGITGGMAVNERPDLFGVFTGMVPNMNVIRTEYLEDFDDSDTAFEFGTIKEEQSYLDLLRMDPVVNLSNDKEYPSTLMIIGFKDYLIPPSGPGKYVALLQSFNPANDKPYLLDVKFDAEHETDWVGDYAKVLYFTMNELKKRN